MPSLYRPLDASRLQIRLLTIHPGDENTPVSCSLAVVEIASVSFDALSYCWGVAHDPTVIEVNDQELNITPNLAAALKHFRCVGVGASTAIWIDAICINQVDPSERSSQVALMGALYKQASTVHIWLGGPSSVLKREMLALEDLVTFTLHHRSTTGMHYWPDQDDQHGTEKLRDLLLLSTNTYWTRTWIVQETAFAMSCIVHGHNSAVRLSGQEGDSSSRSFPFYELLQRITVQPRRHSMETAEMVRLCKAVKDAFYHIETTGFVAKIRDFANEPSYARLITEIFLRYRPLLATDPRDKVYGMLGLLPSRLQLLPDYTTSVRQVYVEYTAELIRSSKDLQIVNDSCSGSRDLPTWVPDLRVSCRFPPYFVQKLITYRASAGLPASFRIGKSECLVTHGRCIDTVEVVERGVGHISSIYDLQARLSSWRALFDRTAAFSTESFNKAQLDNAFWNAITRPSEHAELFDEEDAQLCARVMSPDHTAPSTYHDSSIPDCVHILEDIVQNYDIFLTATGHLGHVPRGHVELGDCLIVLAGAPSPFCAVRQQSSGSGTYALRSPCALMPFDTNPDGGQFDVTNPLMDGTWLIEEAGLQSLLDVHEEHGKRAVIDVLYQITIC